MTAHKEGGVQWRQTSVLIRADIFARAQEGGYNISHECNRALADLTGIDYLQQQLPEELPTGPVIVAPERESQPMASGQDCGKAVVYPVINADDPTTPAKVLQAKKERVPRQSRQEPGRAPAPIPGKPPQVSRQQKKSVRNAGAKKGKDQAIKRFIAEKLVRTDAGEGEKNVIGKDEMYQLFARWCRAHSVQPVPDRRAFGVALKNRFVIRDGTVDGTPSWVNVKLK